MNAVVALLASGGSTNHTIHLIAIARAAGLILNWSDFAELSAVAPLLCNIYPNGEADVNHFHAAGGTGCLFRALLNQGLMHADAQVVWGASFADYTQEPCEREGALSWQQAPSTSLDETVLRGGDKPFSVEGGLKLLTGNLGRSVIKTSAVVPDRRVITAPAVVIEHQD